MPSDVTYDAGRRTHHTFVIDVLIYETGFMPPLTIGGAARLISANTAEPGPRP